MATANEDRKATEGPVQITSHEGKERFGEFVTRAGFGNERIVVMRHGKPVAAIVGLRDLAVIEAHSGDRGTTDESDVTEGHTPAEPAVAAA